MRIILGYTSINCHFELNCKSKKGAFFMKRLSIEEAKKLANSRAGECLSEIYVNKDANLTWKCNEEHIWNAPISHIKYNNSWCPFCAGKKRTIMDIKNYAKSKGGLCLSNEYSGSFAKLKWQCEKGHVWDANPNNVLNNNTWCPECLGKIKSINDMHILAKEKGGECLSTVYINTATKMEWKCANGHIWDATPTNIRQGKWCPVCNSQYLNEKKCRFILEEVFNMKFPKTKSILGNHYELDGYNNKLKLAFEYNGEQHYKIIKRFHMNEELLENRKKVDIEKKEKCKELGISLIIIPYYSFCSDEELLHFICEQIEYLGYGIMKNQKEIDFSSFYSELQEFRELKDLAENRKGFLLSNEFMGVKKKLKWQCELGHIWEAAPDKIKTGQWCPKCRPQRIAEKKRLYTIKDMEKLAEEKAGKCLSDEFFSVNRKLIWQCEKNHIWQAIPSSIKKGHWCPTCNNNKKLTIEEMKKIASARNGECLSEEYINAKTKLTWRCANGHSWQAVPDSVKHGTWCPDCYKTVNMKSDT